MKWFEPGIKNSDDGWQGAVCSPGAGGNGKTAFCSLDTPISERDLTSRHFGRQVLSAGNKCDPFGERLRCGDSCSAVGNEGHMAASTLCGSDLPVPFPLQGFIGLSRDG